MIITRTPYRISFFGGGTDYPEWYRANGGSVLSTTINKYSFLTVRQLPEIFDYRYRIRYYEPEEVNTVDAISVPVIREAIRHLRLEQAIDITHHGDLPSRSGVGSSSSFTVSLLHGLYALRNQIKTRRELALAAINLEQNILAESIGSQDQVAAAFGGFNRIDFGGPAEFVCNPLPLAPDTLQELESWVQLFFTGDLRFSEQIAERTRRNIEDRGAVLRDMQALTCTAEQALFADNIAEFARLLNTEWHLKRAMEQSVTNPKIDTIIARGLQAGAVGAKLLGAGGGGFVLFLTPPELQPQVSRAIDLRQVPVLFEHLGSQLIYCDYQDRTKHYD